MNATLALDRLEHDRGDLVGHCRLEGIGVVERNVRRFQRKWVEWLAVLRLGGGGERAEGPAVIAPPGRDQFAAPGRRDRELERRLDASAPELLRKNRSSASGMTVR